MESQHFANRAGWTIILYGVSLSFIAAFTPFFEAGYLFKVDILLAGLLPYLIYAIAVPLLPGPTTTITGIILVAAHTVLVVVVRLLGGADSLIYAMPIIMAVLVLPLVIVAVIKTDVHKPGRT
ncbi:MAG: hypothetical protein HKM94_01865 [Halobacteria archaeon]|nr:hypothetical protein [Halobacteria archaeon]